MMSLIKCHLNYLISKTTIIVSMVVLSILSIISFFSLLTIEKGGLYIANNYFYFNNIFVFAKFILVVYSIFLFGYSFTSKADQYVVILIASGILRTKIIISKFIAICFVIFIVVYIVYFEYLVIGFLFYREFIFEFIYLKAYFYLYLLVLFFGLISLILIQKFDNIYTIIIPFLLMNLSEVINGNKNLFVRIVNIFILYLSYGFRFYYTSIHAIILLIILFVINVYYYKNKDIKN